MEFSQWLAVAIFAITILVVVTNVIDSTLAALIGVVAMIWLKVMSEDDAFKYVDWNVMAILVSIWLIAGYFGKSGVPSWLFRRVKSASAVVVNVPFTLKVIVPPSPMKPLIRLSICTST